MDDKTYYFVNYKLVVADDNNKRGISITAMLEDEYKKIGTLSVRAIGFGSCFENDELIFLFEDGEKLKLNSYSGFNCDGKLFFDMKESYKEILSSKKLVKVRVTSGRDGASYTKEVEPTSQEYFIKVYKAIESNDVRMAKK